MAQQFRLVKYYNLPRILGKSRAFFFLCVRIRIRRDSPLLTPLFHHTFLLSQLSSPLASIHPIGNRYQITTRINPQNGEVGSFTVRISQMSRPFCIQISCQPMNRKIWDCRNWISTQISLGFQDFLRCCLPSWQFFLHFLLLIGKVPFKYQIMTILENIPLINIPAFFLNQGLTLTVRSHFFWRVIRVVTPPGSSFGSRFGRPCDSGAAWPWPVRPAWPGWRWKSHRKSHMGMGQNPGT